MKKKSASQSAFFNPRALIGLLLVLAGLFLAVFGFGVAQAKPIRFTPAKPSDPLVPANFDCSKIHELGIDRQENLRAGAIMIACGQSEGGKAPATTPLGAAVQAVKQLFSPGAPDAYGGTDVDLVTGPETSPNIVQSETYTMGNPDNALQILSAYNDSRGRNASPINISGASYSSDGGTTFTRITGGSGQSPFAGTEGDPVALFHRPSGTWLTVWLDTACGGQGLGGYKTTTPAVAASWTHFCVYNEGSADRESGWADQNPASPFYGRLYISWNDFAVGSGALFETFSTDGGATWHAPITVINAGFIRDVQITGDSANGNLYLAGMDEGGGNFPHNDINKMFRSTDGGLTWANTYSGPAFPGPGVTAVGYFACMFPDAGGYWRHEGWGEPAALNNVVNLVYAQHGAGADAGDVYAIRSTDMGVTFGAPFKLNSDATTRPQWQPSLSVTSTGSLFATWYDGRESATCTKGNPAVPCYRVWGRKSNDNGATWLPDDTFSDVVSPLPAQSDPGIQATYAGDYDYGSALLNKNLKSWVDGRVAIGGASQQDAFTDGDLSGFAVTSTVPACGSVISTQPTNFVVNLSGAVNTSTVQASDFTVNGIPSNLAPTFTNANATITFHFSSTPVTVQGLQTMAIPAGAFNQASDNAPVLAFTCTFRYDVTLLAVTTTVPAVGGTFTGPGSQTYDVNWNEAVDPASVQASDLTLSGVPATVTNVTVLAGNLTTRFTINFTGIFSGTVTASIAAGAITDSFGNPNAAFTGNYNYVGSVCDSGIIQNGGFETGDFTSWILDGILDPPTVVNTNPHGGTYSALIGSLAAPEPTGDSSFYQQFAVPAGGGTLSFWHQDATADSITFDWQDAYITDSSGTILQTIFHVCDTTAGYVNTQVDMTPYAGQTVRIKFLVHQDGFGDVTSMYVDDVTLFEACSVPVPSSAVSRKVHGGAGTFDVNLPVVPIHGAVGIEDRTGPVAGAYQMVITFPASVTVTSAAVTSGVGTVGSVTGSGTPVITVNLTGVTDAQRLGVTLMNVTDSVLSGNVLIPMGVLAGDTNASGAVSAADVSQTKQQSGHTTTAANFREDVNASGSVNAGDVALVKNKSGNSLPP